MKRFVTSLNSDMGSRKLALHDLLYALFTQDRGNSSRYTFAVYRFLVLYSFRREGHLAQARVITQYISAIVFFGRGTIFNAIMNSMDHEGRGYFA